MGQICTFFLSPGSVHVVEVVNETVALSQNISGIFLPKIIKNWIVFDQ